MTTEPGGPVSIVEDDARVGRAVASGAADSARELDPAPLPARILVVDPDAMIHRTMQRLLRGHDVACVTSARDALALVGDGARFDIILTELLMPVMTGIELYHRVRASDPEIARRVVFVTSGVHATASAEQFLRAITSSNLTLEKPFGQPEINALVTRMLADRLAG